MVDQRIDTQNIVQGPMASQVAIKMLGTNGGGYVNANAAHPFENPTPLSNFIQMLSIFAIPSALTYYLGRTVRNQKHGWAIWAAMLIVFLAGALVCWHYEAAGNPNLAALGVDPADGNMEGKEVRFGIFNSALFATITTDASCGAVNAMHDSFTPMGGLVPLFNIHLGEVIFGGVGSGLYGMLVFVVLAVFIAGLMVGRTPEYLGKKIEPYDVKMASFAILVVAFSILGFSAWASVSKWGPPDAAGALTDGTNNNGPHGFTEILYAFSSGAGNNGSAFAGLTTNTPWYNTTLALRHALWPHRNDDPDHCAGRLAGTQEARAQQRGHLPGVRAALYRPADRNRHHRRRAQLLSSAHPGTNRRALPHVFRQAVLSLSTLNDQTSKWPQKHIPSSIRQSSFRRSPSRSKSSIRSTW